MYGMRGAAAYGRVNVESHVISASPHKLIQLLFDGALREIRAAKIHLKDNNVSAKGQAIGKALDIVNMGLLAAVDKEKGGELAERLDALYRYLAEQLVQANLKNSIAGLQHVEDLLLQIASAWNEIAGQANDAVPEEKEET